MEPNATISYYGAHADAFAADTAPVEFSSMQHAFTDKLPAGAFILDFGCGSGRDTKAFLDEGFQIEAMDGSEAMCEIASRYASIPVKRAYFQDLDETERYDGIWACSSILHLSRSELLDVLSRMARALKPHGIIYTSFKYGTFEGMRDDRYFTDMTENTFADLISALDTLEIEDEWVTSDVRPGRGDEKWLNLILRKK